MSPFVILYSILGNIVYVHIPYGVTNSMICFGNNTQITLDRYCHSMKHNIINNNTLVFSYQMKNEEKLESHFKILYNYANKTIFDTNWIEKQKHKNDYQDICQKINNQNLTTLSNYNNLFYYVFLIFNLNICIFIFFIAFAFVIINFYYKLK